MNQELPLWMRRLLSSSLEEGQQPIFEREPFVRYLSAVGGGRPGAVKKPVLRLTRKVSFRRF